MPSGYRSGGVDFDDLFDPDVMGNGPNAPGFRANGQPLRYAHIQYGSKGPDVGRRENGVDISNKWARKGSATYSLGFNGKRYSRTVTALSGQTGTITASLGLSMRSDGSWSIGGSGAGTGESGSWLPAGASASDYQVMFTSSVISGQSPSASENTATGYTALTSVQRINFSNSVNAALAQSRNSEINITCYLRKISTGTVTQSSCDFQIYAQGQA